LNGLIKQAWIDSLSVYHQGHGYMHQIVIESGKNLYCPLGVLVDIYQRCSGAPLEVGYNKIGRGKQVVVYGEGDVAYLPEEVRVWAGLESRCPKITLPSGNEIFLIMLNDRGDTFEYISEIIEKYL